MLQIISVNVMDQTNTQTSYNFMNNPEHTHTHLNFIFFQVWLFIAGSWPSNVEREIFTSTFRDQRFILGPVEKRKTKQQKYVVWSSNQPKKKKKKKKKKDINNNNSNNNNSSNNKHKINQEQEQKSQMFSQTGHIRKSNKIWIRVSEKNKNVSVM